MNTDDPSAFLKSFRTPSDEFYPGVYWFWHHLPQPRQIEQQLKEIHHAGYRTFLIQPRLAFPRQDYLSQDYLDAYRYALQTAKTLGLTAGLYDDYNWISGHAGGRTVAGYDHLRERHLFWCRARVQNGTASGSISGIHNHLADGLGEAFPDWIYEGGKARWGDWQIIRSYACLPGGKPVDIRARTHIVTAREGDCQLSADLPVDLEGGQVFFFLAARCESSRLVNYLHPDTATRFIETGYEPYRRALGDFFGDPLTFVFMDQPYAGFYTWGEHSGNPGCSLMYDEGLEADFQEQRGYELGQALLALVMPENAQTPRLRCDFYETYGGLARQRFLAPLAAWARQHGLDFSGHELLGFVGEWSFAGGLPSLDSRVNFGGDYFAVDAFKTISAVDACNYHPQVSARFGASTARAHSRRACMVEQYSVPLGRDLPAPVGQWDLSLDALRSQAVRHALAGASKLIFHAFYQTDDVDARSTPLRSPRFDFPPGINYEPWFKFHPAFAEELARLNAFLAEAEPILPVALLYPLRTYWDEGPAGEFNAESGLWNRWLSEQGVGYAIISERQLDAAVLLESGFRVLILPAVRVVKDAGFAEQLEIFLEAGGRLIASGTLPEATQETGLDAGLEARIRALFSQHPRARLYPDWHSAQADPDLLQALSGESPVAVQVQDGLEAPLWRWQGRTVQGNALVLFNDSLDERQVCVNVAGKVKPILCDPSSGSCTQWGWYEHHAQTTEIHLQMEPSALVCLHLEPGREGVDRPHIVELAGEARLYQADISEEGDLEISLHCYQPGVIRMKVVSQIRPLARSLPAAFTTTELSPGVWQVAVAVPAMPDAKQLKEGWRLRIPGEYREISSDLRRGWEQAYPAYAGPGYYRSHFVLDEDDLAFRWILNCPQVETAMVSYVNQGWAGARGWPPYHLLLPADAIKLSYNQLEIAVWNTAGNAFYHQTPHQKPILQPAGLIGYPRLLPFLEVQMSAAISSHKGDG